MNQTMTGAVLHNAKDLRVQPCPTPLLRPGMVLLRVRRAGICGSDLHYFEHGYCGAFAPTQPFILGHELTAEIAAVAEDVSGLEMGRRVTVNPARACGFCSFCRSGRSNLCQKTIMLGSASNKPPTDGAFANYVMVRADQCFPLPPEIDDGLGAMIEPFAVALHAVKRAGSVSGKQVLITGGGPIGLLTAIAARAFGAAPVVVSDIMPARRKMAQQLAADWALDPAASDLTHQARELTGLGFDVILEASGSQAALRQAFDLVRPGGTIVQIGTLGTEDIPLPANQLMVREIQVFGSFRYGPVFEEAIRLVAANRVNLRPLVTDVFPLSQAVEAMKFASSKAQVMKVQLDISRNPQT